MMKRKEGSKTHARSARTAAAPTAPSARPPTNGVLLNSNERFRELVENANDAIALLSPDGIIEFVNRGTERLLGWSRDALLGHHMHNVVTPATLRLIEDRTARFTAGERLPSIFDAELVHKDGSIIPVEARARVIRDDAGNVIGYQGIYRDVRERKQAEQQLREREAYFRALSERTADMITIVDATGAIRYVSPSAERILGFAEGAVLGQHGFDFIHPDDVARVMEQFQSLLTTPGQTTLVQVRVRDHAGTWHDIEATGANLLDDPLVRGVVINSRDVTERKQAEEALRVSEERYQQYFDAAPDVIYTLDLEGNLTSLNQAFTARTGWPREEWETKQFLPLIHPDDRSLAITLFQQLREGHEVDVFTLRIHTQDGGYRIGEFRAVPQKRDGVVERIVGISRDVTDREEANARLEENRQLLTRITDTMPELLYLYDLSQHAITYVNSRVTAVLGYTPDALVGKSIDSVGALLHQDDRALLQDWEQRAAHLADGAFLERDVRVRHVNGAFRWFSTRETVCTRAPDGSASRILGIAEDITARKQLLGLSHARKIDPEQIGKRLREFRDELTLTQAEFGQRFGGFDSRQIGTYERGEVEMPLKLVLSMYAQGYPVETVLGTGPTTLLDETLSYLTENHREQRIVEKLIETLHAIYQADRQKMDRVLTELGLPPKQLSPNQRTILQLLEDIKKQRS